MLIIKEFLTLFNAIVIMKYIKVVKYRNPENVRNSLTNGTERKTVAVSLFGLETRVAQEGQG